ncbi:hypothetical protein Tco_0966351 [Tanacetum coccineum]
MIFINITQRSNYKLLTLVSDPKRQFRTRRDLTPSFVHNIFSFLKSDTFEIESEEMGEVDIDTLTMEDRDDDAHEHVERVLKIVDLFSIPGVDQDAMVSVFPITLTRAAKRWKDQLPTVVKAHLIPAADGVVAEQVVFTSLPN